MSSPDRRTPRAGGRQRDAVLDERILEAARQLMAERGYQGMSIGAVAEAAGTTRPTVYLRFAGKEDLATQAIAGMRIDGVRSATEDIRADLIAELRHFQTAVTRPHGLAFVGTVLAEEHQTPGLIARFRERLAGPRRERLSAILERGKRDGILHEELDVDIVTSTFIGSLYAFHLAYGDVPRTWPERVVDTFWAALHSSATDLDSS